MNDIVANYRNRKNSYLQIKRKYHLILNDIIINQRWNQSGHDLVCQRIKFFRPQL